MLAMQLADAEKGNERRDRDVLDPARGVLAGGVAMTSFLGSKENPELPHALLAKYDPGRVSSTHFHVSNQFQIVVGGKGSLGRHQLEPYCVHFSRAYTPYGPIVADSVAGLDLFVIRPQYDPGSQPLTKLQQAASRDPWQITRSVKFGPATTKAGEPLMASIPGMTDDRGLAAFSLRLPPNTKEQAPDLSHSCGQYLLVVNGSVQFQQAEYRALALIFVPVDEGPIVVQSGADGAEALLLGFPRQNDSSALSRPREKQLNPTVDTFSTWRCPLCSFEYSEANGLPEHGIPAGTLWGAIPESWTCPDCSAPKVQFIK